jgi:hypothetical protein
MSRTFTTDDSRHASAVARSFSLGDTLVRCDLVVIFLWTTPGVAERLARDFPAISGELGQFLLKDVARSRSRFVALEIPGDAHAPTADPQGQCYQPRTR